MNKVKIITDSTSDLGVELAKKYDIEVIPLYVNFGEESYKDGVNITTEELYKLVEQKGELPKTSAIDIVTISETFKKWLDLGYDIVFSGISKQMSRTYENALMAVDELEAKDRIFVVDSMNLSTGIGLTILKACDLRDQGLSAKEIAEKMEEITKMVKAQFGIETMDYLYKGGRCSGVAKVFGTLLKIKPIIFVRDGKMTVGMKPLGKMKVALDKMINMFLEDYKNGKVDKDKVFITHSIAFESEKYIRERLEAEVKDMEIISTVAGCVISSHCGRGTIGILYITK
ncbi:MAG: DegV family protein [Acholeplasmatales bacterium]|nr:DegV family protein [Acholeplasmatales bacterium]